MHAPYAQKATGVNWGRQEKLVARAIPGSWGRVVVAGEKKGFFGLVQLCQEKCERESARQINFVINCFHLLLSWSSLRKNRK